MRNYLKKYASVHLPTWWSIGGETLTMDGTTQWLTLPSDCNIIKVDAETAEVYYEINDNASDATAHGFVPTNGGRIIGPLGNLASFSVWGTAADAAVCHVQYFRES